MGHAPNRYWPLFAVVGLAGVGLAAEARRNAEPSHFTGKLWFWAVLVGLYATATALQALDV